MGVEIFNDVLSLWVPFAIALVSLVLNVLQFIGYRRVKNKISVWAKDARSVINSIVGIQKNIRSKKINSLNDVVTNLETLSNFSNSMFISMEEELGNKKREIKPKK